MYLETTVQNKKKEQTIFYKCNEVCVVFLYILRNIKIFTGSA